MNQNCHNIIWSITAVWYIPLSLIWVDTIPLSSHPFEMIEHSSIGHDQTTHMIRHWKCYHARLTGKAIQPAGASTSTFNIISQCQCTGHQNLVPTKNATVTQTHIKLHTITEQEQRFGTIWGPCRALFVCVNLRRTEVRLAVCHQSAKPWFAPYRLIIGLSTRSQTSAV